MSGISPIGTSGVGTRYKVFKLVIPEVTFEADAKISTQLSDETTVATELNTDSKIGTTLGVESEIASG